MTYKIDFEKICNVIPDWNWVELEVGLKWSIIAERDVISYAIKMIDEGIDEFDLVLELSIANEIEVNEILQKLSFLDDEQREKAINKWIYAIIHYAYIYNKKDIFNVINEVYLEFGYPDKIKNLIGYMPCEDGRTLEENIEGYIFEGKKMYVDHDALKE